MCNGFLGLLVFLFILWVISKLFDSNSGSLSEKLLYLEKDLREELDELKHKIRCLEKEINKLKGIPEQLSQEIASPENIETDQIVDQVIDEPIINIIEPDPILEEVISIEEADGFCEILDKTCNKTDFESFIAGNLLNRIGALALIIGMGFFLKYAFDQNWINPVVQILIGFLVSGGLLYGASHFNKKEDYKVFAQGLAGAGIAISYLSIFAAYSFYHLFSYPVAFILMMATTILAFFQALKYDSMAVALLGLAGGFMTPFILYSGENNVAGLFTYLGFLNCWIVGLLYKKETWKAVKIISLLATYIIFFSLYGNSYYSDSWIHAGLFLTVIWGLYIGLDISRVTRGIARFDSGISVSNILNGIMFYSGIYSLFKHNNPDAIAFVTILIALIYLISGILVYNRYNKPEGYLKQNILTSIILLALATNLAYTGYIKAIVWSVEAFFILYLGIKYEKSYIWKSSTCLFSLAFWLLLFNKQTYVYTPIENFTPIFNLRTLAFSILISLSILSTRVLNRNENTGGIQSFYRYSWCTLLFILLSVEINDFMSKLAHNSSFDTAKYINYNKTLLQVIVWSSYSIQLLRSGFEKRIKPFIYCGFIALFIASVYLLFTGHTFTPIERFFPIVNLRVVAFLAVSLTMIFVVNLLKKHQNEYSWSKYMQNMLSYTWCIFIFILLNCEIKDFFAKRMLIHGISNSIDFTRSMILGLAWSLYSLPLIKNGLHSKNSPILVCGGAAIIFALILGLFKGFSFEPIASFTFFFNMRMFMFSIMIIALIVITGWLRENSSSYSVVNKYIKVLQVILSLLILYLLTIETRDLFAKEIYSLAGAYGYYHSDGQVELLRNLKQLSLSGIWLLYSICLMIWGILKKTKPVRYVALSILAITIFKIFVIDLSFLNQLYRIISFIGLGVIMLLSSYYYQKYSKQIRYLIADDLQTSENAS
jgi:uncharacterized membrane protein